MKNNDNHDFVYTYIESLLKDTKYLEVPKEDRLSVTLYHLNVFDNPQKKFKTIHITGSKGKTTVSIVIANIIKKAGYKVGLFTSPYIFHFSERMNLVNEMIPNDIIFKNINLMKNKIDEGFIKPYSFFEILTILAFLCFRDCEIDYAIIEVGIGGLHDATNFIKPIACIFTMIELEHTDKLGNTIESIAKNKAGIIKSNSKVFILEQSKEAITSIKEASKDKEVEYFIINPKSNFLKLLDNEFSFKIEDGIYNVKTTNPIEIFCLNYIFAVLITRNLNFNINNYPHVKMIGRFEIYKYSAYNDIVVDIAHTKKSILSCINEFFKNYKNGVVIFSTLGDKSVELADYCKYFNIAIITKIETGIKSKKSNHIKIYEYLLEKKFKTDIMLIEDNKEALNKALSYNLPILIVGSSYLISKYIPILNKLE